MARGPRVRRAHRGSAGWVVSGNSQPMNPFAKCLIALALAASVGGRWALRKGFAWTTMLARFSQSMPFTEAVAWTFDETSLQDVPCRAAGVAGGERGSEAQARAETAPDARRPSFGFTVPAAILRVRRFLCGAPLQVAVALAVAATRTRLRFNSICRASGGVDSVVTGISVRRGLAAEPRDRHREPAFLPRLPTCWRHCMGTSPMGRSGVPRL